MSTTTADESHLRPAGRATRAAIADAAQRLFAERGYDATSVRAIAAEAGVDPALVIRHFGSKEALFLRAPEQGQGVSAVLDGPIDDLGRRLVRYFLDQTDSGFAQRYIALVQASHHPQIREHLRRNTAEGFIAPLAPRLRGERRELRVALLVAQLGGLLNLLHIQQTPELTGADTADIIELYGDAMQRLLTP